MEPTLAELVDNLMELRRGQGLLSDDAPDRAGPAIRALCGVNSDDSIAAIRQKLLGHLGDLSSELPDYVRPVIQAALALTPETRHRFLHERMQWAAGQVNRDHVRTANRRLEPGFRLLAERLMVAPPPTSAPTRDWHTRKLDAVLRMDLNPPTLRETRVIQTFVDEFDELVAEISAPRDPSAETVELNASIIYGGEIVEEDKSSRNYAAFTIRLPEPLPIGAEHEYQIEFTGPPRSMMRPYYVLTPYRRCDKFSLRVRFPADSLPVKLWKLNGVPSRKVDDFAPTDELLHLDSIHEVSAAFTHLNVGLSYGIQWQPR